MFSENPITSVGSGKRCIVCKWDTMDHLYSKCYYLWQYSNSDMHIIILKANNYTNLLIYHILDCLQTYFILKHTSVRHGLSHQVIWREYFYYRVIVHKYHTSNWIVGDGIKYSTHIVEQLLCILEYLNDLEVSHSILHW